MSAPVDVLAVLRYNAKEATKKWGPDNQDSATLAAIAELIEAAGSVSDATAANYGNAMGLHLALAATGGLNERLSAALARVKGGAA